MDDHRRTDPAAALDRMFDLIKAEAAANPAFGRRLLEAIGYTVVYRGDDAAAAVDPVLVAMGGGEEFRRTFLSFSPTEIKKIGEASGLLAKKEKLPKTSQALTDILWDRAQQRLHDLVPRRQHAAE